MSVLSPRTVVICIAGLAAAGCAEGRGGLIGDGMDATVNGGDGGDDNSGGSGMNSGGNGASTGSNTGMPQCMAATGTCAVPTPFPNLVVQPDTITHIGSVQGSTDLQCSGIIVPNCPTGGPEHVYVLTMPIAGKLLLNLQAGADPAMSMWAAAVYVTAACGDMAAPPIACQFVQAPTPFTPLTVPGPFTQGQKLFIHVDGVDPNAKGAFTLTATVTP